MSADNWRICPRCLEEKTAESLKRKQEAAEAYGKVDKAIWVEMDRLANEPMELAETLREDYEIGTSQRGEFSVSYGCRCECGFSFKFKHEATAYPTK